MNHPTKKWYADFAGRPWDLRQLRIGQVEVLKVRKATSEVVSSLESGFLSRLPNCELFDTREACAAAIEPAVLEHCEKLKRHIDELLSVLRGGV